MEHVILKRPFWDGRVLHPRGPAHLPGPVPSDAEYEDGTLVAPKAKPEEPALSTESQAAQDEYKEDLAEYKAEVKPKK